MGKYRKSPRSGTDEYFLLLCPLASEGSSSLGWVIEGYSPPAHFSNQEEDLEEQSCYTSYPMEASTSTENDQLVIQEQTS